MRLFSPRFWVAVFALLLAGWATAGAAPAEPLVKSREWRVDPTGQETLKDARQATDWQALPEWKSWGFGPETVWVRLHLSAASPGTYTPWVVRVRPPFLDYVTLHDPDAGLRLFTGDAVPPESEGLESINFTFQIPALEHERSVYLQLRTTSTRILNAEVLPLGEAQRQNRLQEWLMGFAMVASAIFAIWAWAQWGVTREKVMGAFALKQSIATAWAFFNLGFARVAIGPWLPEGVLTALSSTVGIGLVSMTLWFFKSFMAAYQPSRTLERCLSAIAIFVAATLALQGLGHTRWAMFLANAGVLLGFFVILLGLLTARSGRGEQPIPLPIFAVYMGVYSTLNTLPILVNLGLIEGHPITLYGNLAHMVMDGFVMFILLQVRARALRIQQQNIALDLQRSQQAMEAERRHRDEQSQLFAMLAHEIKTPLTTLRLCMEMGQLRPETMERAIADMNSVIERCVHTSQLADQGLRPTVQAIDVHSLTQACVASCRDPGRVTVAAPDAGALMYNDSQMLSIVLGNLMDNALKYSAAHSAVEVHLARVSADGRPGWQWRISNEPGTAGLPDTQYLFTKYYRAPHARRMSGSGLGLFLVKGLTELMQGSIAYAPQAGRAAFCVWMPDTLAENQKS